MVFSAKEQTVHNCTDDRSQTSTPQDEDKTEVRVSPWRKTHTSERKRIVADESAISVNTRVKSKLPWFSSVQPRALTHISYTGRTRARPTLLRLAHAPTHAHLLHTSYTSYTWTTLDYTRYGYVKPIDFVNCRNKKCSGHSKETRTIFGHIYFLTSVIINISNCIAEKKSKRLGKKKKKTRFTTDPFEKIRARIVTDSVHAFQAERNRFERQWTRIYGWNNFKKKNNWFENNTKPPQKKTQKRKENEHENWSKIRGLWHTFGCRTDDETTIHVSYVVVTLCIPELTQINPELTWHTLRRRMSKEKPTWADWSRRLWKKKKEPTNKQVQENVRGEGRWNDKDDASTNATYVVCHVRKEEKKSLSHVQKPV